jgi:hypothetical protein
MGFEVFMAVTVKVTVLWDVTPCIWEISSDVSEESGTGSSETLVICFWQ